MKDYNDANSPYRAMSDRVRMIGNQHTIMRSAYDALNKDYLGINPCNRRDEIARLAECAISTMCLGAELLAEVRRAQIREAVQ